jgi:hypothetical protein
MDIAFLVFTQHDIRLHILLFLREIARRGEVGKFVKVWADAGIAGWIGIFERDLVVVTIFRSLDVLGAEAQGEPVQAGRPQKDPFPSSWGI